MVMLSRSLRIQSVLLLPNGTQIRINTDAEASFRPLIAALNGAIEAAVRWKNAPGDDEAKQRFYDADRALLQAVMGERNLNVALKAYDGDLVELCTQLDGWLANEVAPVIRAASEKRMEARKAEGRRALRLARRRMKWS